MNTADLIWLNGEFVAWEDAKVHVLTHALHYGTGVFEGIRAYETERGTAIFRHQDHLNRLEASAKLYYMDLPFSKEQLREATHELIARNGFKSCYIRPLVWRGYGPMGLNPLDNPVEAMVAVWEWGAYLGEEGKRNGVRGRVSSYRRISLGLADPALEGVAASTSTRCWRRSSRSRRATRRRSCSTTRATSARAPARTSSWSRTA